MVASYCRIFNDELIDDSKEYVIKHFKESNDLKNFSPMLFFEEHSGVKKYKRFKSPMPPLDTLLPVVNKSNKYCFVVKSKVNGFPGIEPNEPCLMIFFASPVDELILVGKILEGNKVDWKKMAINPIMSKNQHNPFANVYGKLYSLKQQGEFHESNSVVRV